MRGLDPRIHPSWQEFFEKGWIARSSPAMTGNARSLDDVVGGDQQALRNGEAECPGGAGVDDELELGRLHHREIAGLLAFKDARGVDAGFPVGVGDAGAV